MKGQSAIEFISVYGFMLIIASLFIALVVLFAFSAQNSIQTSQCNGFSGLYCTSAQVVYNSIAKNSLIFIALDSEQSAPVNIIGINVVVSNATYSGTCKPSVAAPAERVNCIAGVNAIKRIGQQIVGSYTINGQYCNSPLYNISVQACTYQNVTYTGFFSTYVTNHLSLGYDNVTVAANVVGAVSGSFFLPQGVAFSPDGSYTYVTNRFGGCCFTGDISVISTSTNTVTSTISPSLYNPSGVAIAPSGTYAYVTNDAFTGAYVEVVDTATGTGTGSISIPSTLDGYPQGVAISPSGTYGWVAGYGNVLTINTGTQYITGTSTNVFTGDGGVVVAPNGTYAYVTTLSGSDILVVDTANGDVANVISSSTFSNLNGITISPDGKYLYVSNTGINQVAIISTATDKVVSTINKGFSNPLGIAFAPSGSFLYVVNGGSNNVVIVNPGTYN